VYPGYYAKTQPDKLAAVHVSAGTEITYRELNERSNRLAHALYEAGLRPGDHLALFLENHIAFFEVIWACLRSGLYLTPINRHLSAFEAAYIADDCDAKALIASAALDQSIELGQLSPRCNIKLSVGGAIEGFVDYDSAIGNKSGENLAEERTGSMMLYSSGTTGRPKGILRAPWDQSPALGNPSVKFFADLYRFDASTIYMSTAPLYHGAPIGFANATIQSGGTVIMMDKFDAETALQLIDRYRVTHSQWVPTMFVRLLKLPLKIRNQYDVSSQRCAVHAAAPCPVDVKKQMIEWWGPVIEEYYSSTETAGMTAISSEEWLKHPGSVGRARGNPFHICDEAGNELPAGTSGLIYGEPASGASFIYHKDPQKTVEARHPSNPSWICIGDVGYLDDEGYLFLTDRKSFMIISGGVNIYPQQIENALALHPHLIDSAVIGVPNEELGEEVKAIVQLAAGMQPSETLAESIKAFVGEKLGKQLMPRTVDFIDEIPRMPTGKLDKKILQAKYRLDAKQTLSQ